MNAGDLRHRVTIQSQTPTVNAIGERVPGAWTDVTTVYASIRPASAKEVAYYQAIQLETTHAITMRYTPEMKPDRRLKFGTRVFNIAGIVNVDECDIELRVLAYETDGAA